MNKTEIAKNLLKRVFVKQLVGAGRCEYYKINGQKDGLYKLWYGNKQLFIHCYFKNGKRDGETKAWDENGRLNLHCHYKNGRLDGEYKEWSENGKLVRHCFFKNGVSK